MSRVLGLMQAWVAGVEQLARRVPELAALLAPGSWPLATVVGLLGLLLLLGGLRLGPLVSGVGGALLGWVAGGLIAPALGGKIPAGLVPWICAGLLGTASLLAPLVYPLAAGALPGALLGAQLAPVGHVWLGALVGAVALGLVTVLLRRLVVAASASIAGASLVAAALIDLEQHVPGLALVTSRTTLLAALGATLAVAGTAFQLGRAQQARPSRTARPAPAQPPPQPPAR